MVNFSEEGLFLIISYLLPGYLINMILSKGLYIENRDASATVYRYLLFSLINIFLYTAVDHIFFNMFDGFLIINEVFIVCIRNIILPSIIGSLILWLMKRYDSNGIIGYIRSFFGLSQVALTLSAWDYVFYSIMEKGGSYIIITLKDNSMIYGKFGSKSFASSNQQGNNSIYLEQTFFDFEDLTPHNSGILIYDKDILAISIYNSD